MSDKKLTLRTPDEAEAVFYEAFSHCDTDVMTALWAHGNVVCVHPGSGAVVGYANVARSWAHIFSNAQPPAIKFSVEKRLNSDDLAVHVVREEIGAGGDAVARVLATNVYQKYAQGWLMVEHHASVIPNRSRAETIQ